MAPKLPPGHLRSLGDFEIVREIGRGGMGVVYEARQVSLNRQVSLKVLSGGLGLTDKAVRRFRREAEAAAKLHHTNIVPVYATGEQEGTHYYAMELINGPSLDRVIKQLRRQAAGPSQPTPFTPSESSGPGLGATGPYVEAPSSASAPGLTSSSLGSGGGYFDQVASRMAEVADALHYAHEQGVIHRDVKPSNLMLSPDGRLSVNDFGLARMLELPGMTLTGEFVGTPAYMSPEQIAAGRTLLDHRTDIYSLGATLYELLTLQPPFRGERRDQVLTQILHKEPKRPRQVNRRVPVDLETICLKALEKDPDCRYQSAKELADDLRRYANRFAIAARRTGPLARLVKWVRRRPGLAGALVLGLLGVLAAAFFAYAAHAQKQRLLAEQVRREQEVVEEKRQSALEKALVAAIGGNFAAADRAVDEAELLGASPTQVHALRGQVALDRGDVKLALQHLEQAVKLSPESVAARALLARAYDAAGHWKSFLQTWHELEELSPVSPEDYLFKARTQTKRDPVRGLVSAEEAVHRLPGSSIARLALAEGQAYYAMHTAQPGDVELAVRYADTAKDMLPGNPTALAISLRAHLVAAIVYGETKAPDRRQLALEQARRDVEALGESTTSPEGRRLRLEYFDFISEEQSDALLRECRLAREKTNYPQIAENCGGYLYRLGKFEEARDTLEQVLPQVKGLTRFHVVRGFVLAELPDGQAKALAAYESASREAETLLEPVETMNPHLILRLFGRNRQAVEACRQLRDRLQRPTAWRSEWYKKLLDYDCGDLSPDQLLQAAGPFRSNQCEATFHIAMTKLAEGDREGPRTDFRQCLATGVLPYFEYRWSRAFLARMEANPAWPPWIPVKP
jgi:serine/threonine protein kinase/Tfp pilus assembly protein PilF